MSVCKRLRWWWRKRSWDAYARERGYKNWEDYVYDGILKGEKKP